MTAVETAGSERQPADGPWSRAVRRSSALWAAQPHDATITNPVPKLPLGQEPAPNSPDCAHRCHTRTARLAPDTSHQLTLHSVGMPRPRTSEGWPMPFAGKDAADPCALGRRPVPAAFCLSSVLDARGGVRALPGEQGLDVSGIDFHSIGPCDFDASESDRMRCSVSVFLDDRSHWEAQRQLEQSTRESVTHEF